MANILLSIAGIKQKTMHCGPACIEMILKFYGYTNILQEDIGKDLRVIDRKGCYPSDIIRYLRRFNIEVVKIKRLRDVEKIIKGRPIILGQRNHFMLLIGKVGDKFIYIDPYTGRRNRATFEWIQREVVDLLIITSKEK